MSESKSVVLQQMMLHEQFRVGVFEETPVTAETVSLTPVEYDATVSATQEEAEQRLLVVAKRFEADITSGRKLVFRVEREWRPEIVSS